MYFMTFSFSQLSERLSQMTHSEMSPDLYTLDMYIDIARNYIIDVKISCVVFFNSNSDSFLPIFFKRVPV